MNFFHSTNVIKKLSDIDKRIIDYINNNADEFLHLNIDALSKKLFVSLGVITNFCKKLGFKSFKDLQIYVAKESTRHQIFEIKQDMSSLSSHVNNIRIFYTMALQSTSDFIDMNDLDVATKILNSASTVFTFGIGVSSLPAKLLSENLGILGKDVKILSSLHDLILWADLNKNNKTVVVLFSNTLETPEVKDMLEICEANDIVTVVITSNKKVEEKNNTLFIRFNLSEDKVTNSLSTFTPKIAQLFIVDIISSWLHQNQTYRPSKISRDNIFKDKRSKKKI